MRLFLLVSSLISLCSAETLVDLSHDLAEDSIRWVTHQKVNVDTVVKGYQPEGYWLESYNLSFSEHTTTHMDAPSHFIENGRTIDNIPLSRLFGPAIVIDITAKVANNNLALLSADDIHEWEKRNGVIPDNSILFVMTGWSSRYKNFTEYFGSDTFGELVFPGIGLDAAKVISNYPKTNGSRIVGVGIDCASLDVGTSTTFPTHVELLGNDIYGLENVNNLDKLPESGATVSVLPLKTRNGSGGPTRIIGHIPQIDLQF